MGPTALAAYQPIDYAAYEKSTVPRKEPGSTWLLLQEGKPWPIVLCKPETISKSFLLRRPKNGYQSPAIILGRYKYTWYADTDLRPYDPCKLYITADNDDKEYEQAFKDAIEFKSDAIWAQFVSDRLQARSQMLQAAQKKRVREVSDSEGDDCVVTSASRCEKKTRISVSSDSDKGSSDSDKGCSDSDKGCSNINSVGKGKGKAKATHLPTPELAPEQPEQGASMPETDVSAGESSENEIGFVGSGKGASTSSKDRSGSDPAVSETLNNKMAKASKSNEEVPLAADPASDDQCILHLGKDETPFLVAKAKMAEYDVFEQHTQFDAKKRIFVKCAELASISAADFMPIHAFMTEGDFKPKFYKDDKDILRLDATKPVDRFLPVTLAFLFNHARSLQMHDLQNQVYEKIRVLYPIDYMRLTEVVKIVFTPPLMTKDDGDAVDALREYLVAHVGEYWYDIWDKVPTAISRVMMEHEDFAQAVYAMLSACPGGGRRTV